ncbi:hypothetical protein AGRA3207_007256 [Actinomadura graeca]|uniref:Lipoprotein with Yx(FWY)xxD motif n=1 Tax=Actinomadura graeca TaxID=2750812 RepID=A0ABX8R3U9_9ACTN|nr:hypothetical protein [Actinomadura graeca]QXJ25727.1 hypothetical protein AGRA3207_007256 [Actinomadura graeca]
MRARFALLGAAVAVIGLAGCGGSSEGRTGKASGEHAGIKVSQSDLGPIITDQAGRTLYAFTRDKAGSSACENECIATWPAFASKTKVTPGQGVNRSLVKHSQRSEGTFQATYGDWPLYYYAGDGKPGDLDGQGVDGEWFVVGADGKIVRREA